MSADAPDFYSLSALQFEEFVARLLSAEGYQVTRPAPGERQTSVDLIARKAQTVIAVEVKHTRRISLQWVGLRFSAMVRTERVPPAEWWLITSADVDQSARAAIVAASGKQLRVIDGAELRDWSRKREAREEVERLREVQSRRRRQWAIAGALTILAIVGVYQDMFPKKAPLDVGIRNVTSALQSLKDLEKQLTALKADMVETERARTAIMQEYSKAKELEKLTAEQLAAVRDAVKQRSWKEWIVENTWSFFLGIASSIVAPLGWEYVTRRWSQRSGP